MTADCALRSARGADVETILLVHVTAAVAHGSSAYSDRQVATWAAKTGGVDRYADAIEDPSSALVVADADGRVVGAGLRDRDGGEIEAVFVDSDRAGEVDRTGRPTTHDRGASHAGRPAPPDAE